MAQSNFAKLAATLAQRPGVTDPGGLAASIGQKKYGAQRMAKAAAQGRPASKVRK